MTKSNSQQNERYKYAKDEANKYADKTYDTYDSFSNALNDYIGTRNDRTYDGDMHNIHKSGGGWAERGKELGEDMVKGFEDYQLKNMNKYLNGLDFIEGWQNQKWLDTADDEGINNYISDKYTTTLEQLDRALKRGSINQYQYDLGLKDLTNQQNIMNSNAQNLGQGVLTKYRDNLSQKYDDIYANVNGTEDENGNKVGGYTLHQYGYDPKTSFNEAYEGQQALFGNDLTNALQGLGNFDISQLIADAKVASGINNSMSDNLLSAIEDRENKKDQQIGLGNQGLF